MAAVPFQVNLVMNADDFGLTPGINRAVAELSASHALTSTTLMATAPAFADAVEIAHVHPTLAVGCHVLLVDGRPCSPNGIPTLRGQDGNLYDSLPRFLVDLQAGHIAEDEIEREAEAQIRQLQNAGIHVTHVDTHKHTHLFPRVARPLLRAATRCGVTAIRNPFEPEWSARLTRGAFLRTLEVRALRGFQYAFHQLCQDMKVRTTDGCLGVSATGNLNAATLEQLLTHAQPGTWELVCHPGYNDAALDRIKTRLRTTRNIEREALATLIPRATAEGRIHAMNFSDL